ncbi:hypothetical protein D3C81_2068890 [compost metagenome]
MAERRGIKRMNIPEAKSTPRITQAAPANCQTLGAVPVIVATNMVKTGARLKKIAVRTEPIFSSPLNHSK